MSLLGTIFLVDKVAANAQDVADFFESVYAPTPDAISYHDIDESSVGISQIEIT